MKDRNDREWLNLLQKGDENAFRQIYEKYYELLCRFAFHLLKDYSLAEEIVDDVIFYLWEHRADILITTSLRAYLIRSVRNECINEYYKKNSKNESSLSLFNLFGDLNCTDFLFVDEMHPLGILLEHELEGELQKYIKELSLECRNVFIKSRFEQKKYDDIACELGISVNTVKYHIKNALEYLRIRLSKYLDIFIWVIFLGE